MTDTLISIPTQRLYATREAFKDFGEYGSNDTEERKDRNIDRALATASATVESATNRFFLPLIASRQMDYQSARKLLLLSDDLLSVTSITDAQGTMSASNYNLYPVQAPQMREPYRWIEITDVTNRFFTYETTAELAITIVGKWGWFENLRTLTPTVSGAHNESVTTLTVSASDDLDVGQTLRIGSEYLFVRRIQATNVTVERGISGSTAAAISDGAAIQEVTPPEPIRFATMALAARYLARAASGFSDRAGTSVEGYSYFRDMPSEVVSAVRQFTRYTPPVITTVRNVWARRPYY